MIPFDKWRRFGAKEWMMRHSSGPVCCLLFNPDRSELARIEARYDGRSAAFHRIGPHPCDELRKRASYVYFAITSTHIKIGQSYDVRMRIEELRKAETGIMEMRIPENLVSRDIELIGFVPGKEKDENVFHRQFDAHCVAGEWHRRDPSMISAIHDIPGLRVSWP